MDKNFHEINQTLIGLTRRMKIVDEMPKNWNNMQEYLNGSIGDCRNLRIVNNFGVLMENIVQQLEELAQDHEEIGETEENTMPGMVGWS